jgi:hypothetical protein
MSAQPGIDANKARVTAEANALAAKQIDEARRAGTSFGGVRLGLQPTGVMLRSPIPLPRGILSYGR